MNGIRETQTFSRQGSLDYSIIRKHNLEAQKRLKKSIPSLLKDDWILHPFTIRVDKCGIKKKCIPLTTDGLTDSPRIIIKSPDDLPQTANAILGRSQKYVMLDFDKIEFIKKVKLPKPFFKIKTGRGEHWGFLNGDFERSYNLVFGEAQFNGRGVFVPGSYHAPTGQFYELIEYFESPDKLFVKDIKPYLKPTKETHGKGTQREFGPGQNNSAIPSRAGKAGARGDIDLAAKDIIDLFKKNANRPNFDAETHLKDYLNFFKKTPKTIQLPPDPTPQGPDKKRDKFVFEAVDTKKDIVPSQWHVPHWLPRIGVVLLTSDKGVGKTALLFLMQKCLVNGVGLKDNFFKTQYPVKKSLFCYGERRKDYYENLWKIHGGKDDSVILWRWASDYKTKKHGLRNFTLKNLRYALEDNPDIDTVYIDRADLLAKENSQFSIRDSGFELDEISEDLKVLFVVTRHTSKPIGTDARQFQEKTSGFKEWQHSPVCCLFAHAHEKKLLLFKVYANECSRDGIIKFSWKNEGGIFIPKYESHDPLLTISEIEQLYNKKETEGKREKKQMNIYKIFEKHGKRCKAFRQGESVQTPVFILSNREVEKLVKKAIPPRTVYWNLVNKLEGWSKRGEQGSQLWHCPVKYE